ncbi:MAG: protein phosphatase 2C domain-containing protein [Lachnospiraceae bacterium]|nr:protein phosphatase 2C domain-containing protein [Lachnospiraceae bacterium]
MKFDVFAYTNKGGRSYNQDHVSFRTIEQNGIFVVADGLGGHSFGELASEIVCNTMVEEWDGTFQPDQKGWLQEKIIESNRRILKEQEERNSVLKSTVVALSVVGDKAVWANVGDSRLYYVHEGEVQSYTNDHSVAYKKYKGGEITRQEICTDPDQSALLRTVGSEDRCKPEIYAPETSIVPGDAFLLCSDGMWEFIRDGEIGIDLQRAVNAEAWAKHLLLRLMDRINEENDNLSIMTVIVK